MDNIERRDSGLAYKADEAVFEELIQCRKLLFELNHTPYYDFEAIAEIVGQLFGKAENAFITPPFYCDYGKHIEVGKNFYTNYNCTILDVAKVKIGDNCFFAPNVAIYTAGHPIHPKTRASGYEYGKAVTIGDNVWIGGNTVVCPGVNIGNNVVIGAGSVVTKDIPDWCVAAGNPCKVIKTITDADKRKLFKNEEIDQQAWDDIIKSVEF